MKDLGLFYRLADVDGELLAACEHGMRLSVNPALPSILNQALTQLPPASELACMSTSVLAWRRQLAPSVARVLLAEGAPATRAAAALGLAKAGHRDEAQAIRVALARDPSNAPLRLALAILGDPAVIEEARSLATSQAPPPGVLTLIAFAGTPEDARTLLQAPPSIEATRAMGTLGMPEFIPELIEHSSAARDPALQAAAAGALNRITGAELRDVVALDADSDDLEEAAERDCQDRARWIEYCRHNAVRFTPGRRYRLGAPFSLDQCVREIAAPTTSLVDRRAAAEEWMIRSGHTTAFEPDGWIDQQRELVDRLPRGLT